MIELITSALLVVGSVFMFLGGVGLIRMPDLFIRLHSATKAVTLGVGCTLGAVCLSFGELGVTTRALLVISFVVLTAPVSAHVIGRAHHRAGGRLWEGTLYDELRDGRNTPAKEES